MARPRRPFGGQEMISTLTTPYMKDELPGVLGGRREARWVAARNYRYTIPNGTHDPMTYMLVLDLLLNIEHGIELRAAAVMDHLNSSRNGISWDSVTVGKVISDLCDAFETAIGAKSGLLERGRDWRGAFYVFHDNPTTARVGWALLDDLMRLTEDEMVLRRQNRKTDFIGGPLLECASVRGEYDART